MSIKAADVAKLRKSTGAGMMDCKKALTEAEGDFDRAIQIIREKGQAIANKRADREATEGAVIAKVSADGKQGAIIALNCETDFVAKNEDFVAIANKLCDIALANLPENREAFLALDFDGTTVEEAVIAQSGITGEKMEVAFYDKVEAEGVAAYIHMGNKLATLIGFNQSGIDTQVGRDVAMQAAAMAPVAIDKEDVSASIVEEELNIGKEKARQEGKPEEMLDKIAQGRLGKFFKENTLLNQMSVKDNKITVAQVLKNASAGLTVTAMKRYALK
ncbi:MAG: translation elongation factor Ts [Salinivirgaceae bacterium]|nr:translation elongation factor Ts [Salinivirgaceae bacterium]